MTREEFRMTTDESGRTSYDDGVLGHARPGELDRLALLEATCDPATWDVIAGLPHAGRVVRGRRRPTTGGSPADWRSASRVAASWPPTSTRRFSMPRSGPHP